MSFKNWVEDEDGCYETVPSTTETVHGIEYSKPQVVLLQDTGIGTAEYAARTCYDSFEASENPGVKAVDNLLKKGGTGFSGVIQSDLNHLNRIEHSDLLDQLAWTHFHHSILEHANLTYLIKGTSRGVLQEHARHRIQAISVRSTRYTMSSVINAFVASTISSGNRRWFVNKCLELNMLVTTSESYNSLELGAIWDKMHFQKMAMSYDGFLTMSLGKEALNVFASIEDTNPDLMFESLEKCKKKRNVGDAFKHIVTDNWKVDMVVTMNVRALKNYLTLRDSGAAYFQIRWLAQAMKDVTPSKYLDLIIKNKEI